MKIEIDEAIPAEAMAAAGCQSQREAAEAGLRLLVPRRRQAKARQRFGRVQWEGDLGREAATTRGSL